MDVEEDRLLPDEAARDCCTRMAGFGQTEQGGPVGVMGAMTGAEFKGRT